jgi:hypothetical protein
MLVADADACRIEPRTSTWDMPRMALRMRLSTWGERLQARHEGNFDGSTHLPFFAFDIGYGPAGLLDSSTSGVDQQLHLLR